MNSGKELPLGEQQQQQQKQPITVSKHYLQIIEIS